MNDVFLFKGFLHIAFHNFLFVLRKRVGFVCIMEAWYQEVSLCHSHMGSVIVAQWLSFY